MTTVSARLGLLKPDDGGPGGDDTVNVTTQISDNYDKIDAAVGIYHVANAGALPVTNLYVGRLCQLDDTGAVYQYNGSAWVIFHDTKYQTYPVTWTAAGGGVAPGIGNGTLTGKFFRLSPFLVRIIVEMATGNTTVNGTGDYQFSVPSNALLERTLTVLETGFERSYLYLPTTGWGAWTPSTGKLQGAGLFPMAVSSATDNRMAGWKNAAVGSGAGSGTPNIPGQFTMPTPGGVIYQCSVLAEMS